MPVSRPVIQDGRRRPGYPVLVSRCLFGHRHSLPGHPVPARELGLPCGRLPGSGSQGRTPTGLPRSARMSCGRGGCPLSPGDCGPRTAGRSSPAAACRLAAAGPYPRPATHHRRLLITRHHQGFTVVHPSGLPWPVAPGWSGSPGLVPPGLHTPPLPAAHVGVGTGIVGTCLSYVTISWSSHQRSHSPRATSCRTDLIRACALHLERPIPVLSATQQ